MYKLWRRRQAVRSLIVFCLVFLCSCSAVQQLFGNSGVEVQIGSNPAGVTDLKSGTLMTLTESKPISSGSLNIKLPKTENKNTTSLVAAKFGDELRLLDFVIPSVNDKPKLDFESTARGLVFMNPLFWGLPFEARVAIFKDIPKHSGFEALKQKVTSVKSLSDKDLIQAEMEIAFDIAKQKGILIATTATPNAKPASNPSQPATNNTPPQISFDQEKFPKPVCGDQLPSDAKSYPLDIYPVFADYSDKNFQIITTQFCQDAIRSIRQDTNKETIQVGSFIGTNRAEAFRSFLQKKITGKVEVGKATRIEGKRSSLPTDLFSNWFGEPANAQGVNQPVTNLEYKLTKQFDRDFEVRGYPYHHGYELQATSDGIKISGGSILAQQVIVVPKDKVKWKDVSIDDYGGKKLLDQDVVAELLLKPQEIGIWDGTIFTTASGGNRTEQTITPKDSEKWKHGDYTVIISAGAKLNRKSDKQKYGALEINFANMVSDIFTLSGLPIAKDIISVSSDCMLSNDFEEIFTCLKKPDNLVAIAGAYGIENEDIVQKFFKMTFDRETWIKQAKLIGQSIDIFGKGVALTRNAALGQYLNRENSTGLYWAEISIVDPVVLASAPKNVELQCGSEIELFDMKLKIGAGGDCPDLFIKNYSNDVIEVNSKGADAFLVKPNNLESDLQRLSFRGTINRVQIGMVEVMGSPVGPAYKYPLEIRRINTRLPERDVTFSCNDKNVPVIWGLKIEPKCLESGTYAEYTNYSYYPIEVIFGSGNPVILRSRDRLSGSVGGTLRSSGKTVTIKIRANLN